MAGGVDVPEHALQHGADAAHHRLRRFVFKVFCKSKFPHRFVNLIFILVLVMDKLTGLLGV